MGCQYHDVAEVGARYDGSFNGVSISGSAGFEHGDAARSLVAGVTTNYHDLSAFQTGLQLGYAGVLIGASYLDAGKSGYATTAGLKLSDQTAITAGISYEIGPVVVGFNYAHGEDAGDVNAYLANFWRALKYQPDATWAEADYPVSHLDLGARHRWLTEPDRVAALSASLADPEWPGDARIAG